MRSLLPGLALLGFIAHARGQGIPRPAVPDPIQAPAGEEVLLVAHASGSQIYTCDLTGGAYAWKLKAPEAELRDSQGILVGHHFAGPTWKRWMVVTRVKAPVPEWHNDGSEVVGKAVAKADSPETNSIPWLLVTAISQHKRRAATRRL